MLLLFESVRAGNSSGPQLAGPVWAVAVCAAAYQVLVGEPCDLVLQAGFDSSFRRQLEVLGQELLLTVVVLLHGLQLAAQRLHLHVVSSLLSLQLVLQQPWSGTGRGDEEGKGHREQGERAAGRRDVWEQTTTTRKKVKRKREPQ